MLKFTIFSGSFLLIHLLLCSACSEEPKIQVTTVTPESLWTIESIPLPVAAPDQTADIVINMKDTAQTIEGFGGCFNELGWQALKILDSVSRMDIIRDIFDPDGGCGFNICRMPIGANDYAIEWYSYDEEAGDYDLEKFSIDRDRRSLIPYIRSALAVNPDLRIWASPWCPPAWMKTNGHYACRMDAANDLPSDEYEGAEGTTQFIMNDRTLSAYARYFSKFILAYAGEGIDIYAVHVQNEPNSCQNFPSCIWTASDLTTFIGKYLGPRFNRDNLTTEIWYGTIERPSIQNIDTALNDPAAREYIRGVGFQWAGKGAIAATNRKYPDIRLMQTESECGDGSNDWAAALHTFDLLKYYLENGANAYMYWNMVLDETGKSHWGWRQNSLITINRSTGKITRNPEYFLMKLFSSQVDPGAKEISIAESGNSLVFRNPDHSLLIIAGNRENREISRNIRIENRMITVRLKPNSFSSFHIPFNLI